MIKKCKYLASSTDGKKAIYLDEENEELLRGYLFRNKRHINKTRFFLDIILNGHRHRNYCKVEINEKCENVTEMRFFVGQENDRIYCKEIKSSKGGVVVVAAILHEGKKSKSLSSKEIELIKKVGGYDYEI
ncbi:MAG: hypothetical protein WKF97_21010 [Chitinophagaceae bacterium]